MTNKSDHLVFMWNAEKTPVARGGKNEEKRNNTNALGTSPTRASPPIAMHIMFLQPHTGTLRNVCSLRSSTGMESKVVS